MSNARYLGRCVDKYDRDSVDLEYEYRDRTYWVHIHNTKGNEPLVWQHRNAQSIIDKEIALEEKFIENNNCKETVEESLDKFFEYLETGEWKE